MPIEVEGRTSIQERLRQAREDGADRLYGWAVERQTPGPRLYQLQAVDGTGRCHFRRRMQEEAYFAAVKVWMSLTAPHETIIWRKDAA